MTTLVLACPFLDCGEGCGACPAHVAAVAMGDEGYEHCCDLHSRVTGVVGHLPAPPERAPCDHHCPHGGKDCLCNGAIIPGMARCPDQDQDIGCAVAVIADESVASLFAAEHDVVFSFCQGACFSPLISGRGIRTLVGSLLL